VPGATVGGAARVKQESTSMGNRRWLVAILAVLVALLAPLGA
jgi:hypothetical protein